MDARGRRWFASGLQGLNSRDRFTLTNVFTSLTDFFDRSVGVWFVVSGTTDANGEITFNHNAPFTPSVVMLTAYNDGVSTHADGPFHIDNIDSDSVTVHCLNTTSGSDASFQDFTFHVLCLP